jgi:hypothetical protein
LKPLKTYDKLLLSVKSEYVFPLKLQVKLPATVAPETLNTNLFALHYLAHLPAGRQLLLQQSALSVQAARFGRQSGQAGSLSQSLSSQSV